MHHQLHIPRTYRSFLDTLLVALYTYTMAISNLSSTIVEPTRSRSKRFNGVIPAVVSPHDGNDNFCAQSFARQIEFLYEQGVHGVYVCGGTGEGYSMRLSERKTAIEIATELSKTRGITIDHVGAQCTRDAAELADHAAHCGADALASIPPLGKTQQELRVYYSELGKVSGLPVLIYYIPALTGQQCSLNELLELLDVEGVIGLKFTDSNLFLMRRLIDARPDTVVFSGFDELLFPALLYGATGGIGTWYNIVPQAFLKIFDAAARKDCNAGWQWQHSVIKLADIGWRFGIHSTVELLLRESGRVLHSFRSPHVTPEVDVTRRMTRQLNEVLREMKL